MIDVLLSRLQKVRRISDGRYQACCPAHNDKSPSMAINTQGDIILFHCFAGCAPDEILQAVDLKWTDLYPDEWDAAYHKACAQKIPLEPVEQRRVEENVLLIVQNKLEAGEELSAEDQARAEIALERITHG